MSASSEKSAAALGKFGPLMSGAFAGLAVDLALFPIDTIKTRLQSGHGFAAAGGFKAIYAGMPSVLVGSAPGSALFFCVYELTKRALSPGGSAREHSSPKVHMTAACLGEVVACLIRVPTELVKQRAQSFPSAKTKHVFKWIIQNEGVAGLYRGYGATICREIPFSLIEFPLWEYLKQKWSDSRQKPVSPWQGAACGSVSGAIAAGITTPLDVAKTRIMLSQKLQAQSPSVIEVLRDVWAVKGVKGLYAGFWPRTVWMTLGGFVFFGAYEAANKLYDLWFKSAENPSNLSPIPIGPMLYTLFNKAYFEPLSAKAPYKTFDDVIADAKAIGEKRREFTENKRKQKQLKEKKEEEK